MKRVINKKHCPPLGTAFDCAVQVILIVKGRKKQFR